MSRSTPERSPAASFVLTGLLVVVLAACETSEEPTAPTSTRATSAPVTATTLPPAEVLEGAQVEPCEAGDESIVSAHVADLGGHLAADEDGVWLSRFGSPEVIRVDGETLCPESPTTVPGADLGVASMATGDDGRLYVAAAQSGAVAAIDPVAAEVVGLAAEASGGGGMAMADGRLWAVCCDPSGAVRASAVFDAESGELLTEIDIDQGTGVALTGDVAWVGRADAAGLYRISDSGAEVEAAAGTGTSTSAVTVAGDTAYMVGDEPVLQRWAGGAMEEVAVLPFPRQRPADIAGTDDGSVFAVSAFSPGVFWVRPDGQTFTVGNAENLIQVEVAGDRVWTLDTGGTLTRIDRSVFDG